MNAFLVGIITIITNAIKAGRHKETSGMLEMYIFKKESEVFCWLICFSLCLGI